MTTFYCTKCAFVTDGSSEGANNCQHRIPPQDHNFAQPAAPLFPNAPSVAVGAGLTTSGLITPDGMRALGQAFGEGFQVGMKRRRTEGSPTGAVVHTQAQTSSPTSSLTMSGQDSDVVVEAVAHMVTADNNGGSSAVANPAASDDGATLPTGEATGQLTENFDGTTATSTSSHFEGRNEV
eukprot:gene35834-43461_t